MSDFSKSLSPYVPLYVCFSACLCVCVCVCVCVCHCRAASMSVTVNSFQSIATVNTYNIVA